MIVSALIQKNYPYHIINDYFLEGRFTLCTSDEMIKEYYEVLGRPKFSKFQDFHSKAEAILADIESRSVKYTPKIKLEIISDIDDNKILELAEECLADFIVTGNTNDFTFSKYKKTMIVTPKEYWELCRIQ